MGDPVATAQGSDTSRQNHISVEPSPVLPHLTVYPTTKDLTFSPEVNRMKNIRIRSLVIVCALAVVAGAASLAARDSRGQSRPAKTAAPMPAAKRELLKPTVLAMARKPASSTFAEASAQNAVLRNELIWSFGSKPQQGWFLYDMLIGQTLNAPPR